MKTLTTERQAKSTYLKRELVRLSESAWWAFRDDHPDHPMVLALTLQANEFSRKIKELEGSTSRPGRKGSESVT